jgi:hypothetical protein
MTVIAAILAVFFTYLPVHAQGGNPYLDAGIRLEKEKQFLPALLNFDRALQQEPTNAAIISHRDLCARSYSEFTELKQPDSETLEAIKKTLASIKSDWNQHNLEAVMSHYSPDYLNNDGLNRSQVRSLTEEFWQTYGDARSESKYSGIGVYQNYACARSIDLSNGFTNKDADVLGKGRLKSTTEGVLILKRNGKNEWLVAGDIIFREMTSVAYGSGQTVQASFMVPETVPQGWRCGMKATVAQPPSSTMSGSITLAPLQYPMPSPDDNWVTFEKELTQTLTMPSQFRNALAMAKIAIKSADGANMTGVMLITQRINAQPSGSSKGTLASIAASGPALPAEAAVATAASVNPSAVASTPIADKWALVIGISKFSRPQYNLKFAAKDAMDFRDFLINEQRFAGDHIKVLLNEQSTRQAIMSAFGDSWLPRVVMPGDLVVIYISTHGTPSSQDAGAQNYIVAYDTDKDALFGTGVNMNDLCAQIKQRVRTDRVLIVLDTCYSGAAASGARGLVRSDNFDPEAIAQGSGRLVISSSSPNEQSWESKQYQNGIFTHCLINALRQKSGKSDVLTAFDKIKKDVEWEVQSTYGVQQTPKLGGNWQGIDLILSAPPSSPRRVPHTILQDEPSQAITVSASRSKSLRASKKKVPSKSK